MVVLYNLYCGWEFMYIVCCFGVIFVSISAWLGGFFFAGPGRIGTHQSPVCLSFHPRMMGSVEIVIVAFSLSKM